MAKKKIPKIGIEQPIRKKEPSTSKQFVSDDKGCVFWSFSLIDPEGPWGFSAICRNELYTLITSGFKDKEGVSWAELKSKGGCHNVEISKLVKKAKDRLAEKALDDRDELFSMRFSGVKRVWGIRDGNVFKVLWWDPNHEVCPAPKKYT